MSDNKQLEDLAQLKALLPLIPQLETVLQRLTTTPQAIEEHTIAELSAIYLPTYLSQVEYPKDIAARFNTYLLPEFGALTWRTATTNRLQAGFKQWGHLAPQTLKHMRYHLKRLLELAQGDHRWPPGNPVKNVRVGRIPKTSGTVLSKEELVSVLNVCTLKWFRFFLFMALTGCRRGEAFRLKWVDVDLERKVLTFRKTKTAVQRTVPIHSELLPVLALMHHEATTEHVFVSKLGKPYSRWSKINERLNARLEAARIYTGWEHRCSECPNVYEWRATGDVRTCPRCARPLNAQPILRKFRPHDLRHTAETLYRAAGTDPLAIRLLTGRETTEFSSDRYLHMHYEWQRTELDKLRLFPYMEPPEGTLTGTQEDIRPSKPWVVGSSPARRAPTTFLMAKDVALLIGTHISRVYQLAETGALQPQRVGGCLLFSVETVAAYLRSRGQ